MPKASIVVPAYNVSDTLNLTLASLSNQTFRNLEIIVVDDGSSDDTAGLATEFSNRDPRIRLFSQKNRGLSGARNTGIAIAKGQYVGLCDADDLWAPEKLAMHVAHMDANPQVGLSYSGSILIDQQGHRYGAAQRPRLRHITAAHIFKRNPVGNGSAAVFRREALNAITWTPPGETARAWVFDENLRQSEDIECWLRFALSSDWEVEGVPGLLTQYRVNPAGLSADTEAQFQSWITMVNNLRSLNPRFFARHEPAARAYQYRYLARRAITAYDATKARRHLMQSYKSSLRPIIEEPLRSLTTLAAIVVLTCCGRNAIRKVQHMMRSLKTYFGKG